MEPPRQIDSNPNLLEDAELALDELSSQELRLIKEAEELFKRQVDHLKNIGLLQNFIPNMEKVDLDTKRLAALVDSSFNLVEDVCSKVRRIDLAKARLEDCTSKVGDILDLKKCRDGMLSAMNAHNYEEAAMHIKRFLSIDQTELQKTLSIIRGQQYDPSLPKKNSLLFDMSSSANISSTTEENTAIVDLSFMNLALGELEEARGGLLQLCQTNFANAIKEDNTKDIERFFKIFPMLNEQKNGLERYAEYLQSKIVSQQVDEIFKSKRINQADKLAALYESIAKLVDSHQPLLETYYGPGYLIDIVRVIQRECDRLSRHVLEEFRNETKLQYVAKIVKSSSMQVIGQTSNFGSQNLSSQINLAPSKLDPRDVDKILNEISVIISRSEVYLSFIVQRIKDDINCKCVDQAQRQSSLLELYNLICTQCELNHLVQEVGGIYVMLEQFYLNESSKKAILMDQVDAESSNCLVSSMLDDIFFIIKKCTKRAISTKSNEVFCAIINHCVTLLESTFCHVLEERIKNQQYYSTAFSTKNLDLSQAYSAIQSGRYLQSASEFDVAKTHYFSSLNNLDKACDYICTLRGILEVDIKKLKPSLFVIEQQKDNQIEKSVTCLNDLSQLTVRFTSIINSSLYQLFNASLRSSLRSKLKTVLNENPDLPNIIANRPDELTSLAGNLLLSLDRGLRESLTAENYSKLVSILKDSLTSSLKTVNSTSRTST